jgi:hypothetical protein
LEKPVLLDQDFNEFVRLFLDNDVRFLIVGGYAMAAHGLPRYTGDLDTWVWINEQNAERILNALVAFGFGSLDISVEDFQKPNTVLQLGFPPHRIDVLTGIDGVSFDDAWQRRVIVDVEDIQLPFISREDLIANKRAAARPQDLADVVRFEAN